METKEIKLNKEELLQIINKKFSCAELHDFINKQYVHKDEIELSDFNDGEIISEVEYRNWSGYEANEIYEAVSNDLNLEVDDVYYHFNQLSKDEKQRFFNNENIKINTVEDQLKANIILEYLLIYLIDLMIIYYIILIQY